MALKMETQTNRTKQRPEYNLYIDGVLVGVLFGGKGCFLSGKVQGKVIRKDAGTIRFPYETKSRSQTGRKHITVSIYLRKDKHQEYTQNIFNMAMNTHDPD